MPTDNEDNKSSITATPPSKNTISHRLGCYFWGKDPINCLSHTYFVSSKAHKILRYVFMVFHILVLIWTLLESEKPYHIFAYMTLWGFGICTIYFSLVNLVQLSQDSKKRWKFIYVLGEIAATLEFLICPFFFAFLFPKMLEGEMTWDGIVLQVCLHLLCPVFIWIETILNALCFAKRHVWFVVLVSLLYLPNNYVWSVYIFEKPVYPVIDWDKLESIIYIVVAFVMGFAGFFVGYFQYEKKKDRAFVKPKTPNEGILTRLI